MGNQPYETRSMRDSLDELEVDFLHGVPVRLPENTKQQILAWHETEKQKYAMAYADEIIGQSVWDNNSVRNASSLYMPVTSSVMKKDMRLRDELRELNKTKGGKI